MIRNGPSHLQQAFINRDAGAEGGGGWGGFGPPLFPANKEIYVILQNNCLSIKFQFLLSMWPTILRSISTHYSVMKFFSKYRCMHAWQPLILRSSPLTSYVVPASLIKACYTDFFYCTLQSTRADVTKILTKYCKLQTCTVAVTVLT